MNEWVNEQCLDHSIHLVKVGSYYTETFCKPNICYKCQEDSEQPHNEACLKALYHWSLEDLHVHISVVIWFDVFDILWNFIGKSLPWNLQTFSFTYLSIIAWTFCTVSSYFPKTVAPKNNKHKLLQSSLSK